MSTLGDKESIIFKEKSFGGEKWSLQNGSRYGNQAGALRSLKVGKFCKVNIWDKNGTMQTFLGGEYPDITDKLPNVDIVQAIDVQFKYSVDIRFKHNVQGRDPNDFKLTVIPYQLNGVEIVSGGDYSGVQIPELNPPDSEIVCQISIREIKWPGQVFANGKLDSSVDKSEPFVMGIDEAGRGPVMGPMVYGCCYAPISKSTTLKSMKFNDSKKLTEQQRDQLFDKMGESNKILAYETDVITAEILSEKMLYKKPISLNVISHESAIGLIRSVLKKGVNVQELYLDTVGPPDKYQLMLKKLFPEIGKIIVSKKADSLYPIVSAASIAAKVVRDFEITNKNFDYLNIYDQDEQLSTDFGSGYPSDPLSKKWLVKNRDKVFGYPNFIRFSWKTTETAMRGACFGVDWVLENDKLKQHFQENQNDKKRFMFFKENNIENCINDF